MKTVLVALALASLAAPAAAVEMEPFRVCMTCHGAQAQGQIEQDAPALAGQEVWYLERQLQNFQSGVRGTHPEDVAGAQMRPMAWTLPDAAATKALAERIATMPAVRPERTLDGDAERGKGLYATCAACHGANGEGMAALNAPRLTGLPDWYAVRQLKNFKAGIRGSDPKDTWGATMAPMAMTLPDEQAVKDVVAYIATLGK